MHFDVIWTGVGILGGLFLLDGQSLNRNNKIGVWMVILSFLAQTYYEISQPWVGLTSLLEVVDFTAFLVIAFILLIKPGFAWRWKIIKNNNEKR